MMAWILLRMVCELLAGLVAFTGGLILVGIGQKENAFTLIFCCGVVAWIVRPNADDRAAFARFQESRERFPPG